MQFEIGTLCVGRVTKITDYGAFVSLDGDRSGMVHISEISERFVKSVAEHLKVGDEVRVKIIKIDEAGRLSLSIKQAQTKPADSAPDVFRKKCESSSFEDMMSRFMSQSNDKMSDLKQRGEQPRRRRKS